MAPSLTGLIASEDGIVEKPALALLHDLGWQHVDLRDEVLGATNPTGRTSFHQVHLPARLRAALARLNPGLPSDALKQAEEALTRDRSAMLPLHANRELLALLVNGVSVQVRRESDGKFEDLLVRAIDWKNVTANDFLVANQVWIEGVLHKRRPDTIGYVNGLPLLLAEWKAPSCPLADAYDKNLRDYRDTIPQLFDANGFVILSNGLETVMGGSHAPFETFAPWKRLEEDGPEDVSLETLLRATCEPSRLLDLIENFVLFDEARGGLRKIVGKYHQVLGVNRAIEAVQRIEENQGRLGVFWHTQGSGKSLSMAMFAEKVLRRLGGNYTFVIVTDRNELDDQIATQFATVGALTKDIHQAQAGSRAHLKELLAGNERYVFTLIQKFSTADQEAMPVLSERSDIIVMTDEAHRSQYDQLAANMRAALPNAAFIGFTGTPLIKGEESRTREVFGDYVSVYDFAQSVKDGATVPLYYEARKPELQLDADELREEMDALLDEAMLDEEQEKKLNREFARQYTLITNPDRLDKVAEDTAEGRVDLSGIDFDKLADLFAASPKVAAERLREEAEHQAKAMAERNPTRVQLVERLEKLVAEYNAGSIDAERFFEALKAFIGEMDDEEHRAAREGLTEEELAIFDLLTTPEPKLTKSQEQEVKRVAKQLLERLHALVDAVDWVRGQETRGAVWSEIRVRLNDLPEQPYPEPLWNAKVDQVWDFVLRRYAGANSITAN